MLCFCVCCGSYSACKQPASCYIFCRLSGSTLRFSVLSHKQHDFQKRKYIEHKICVGFLYNSHKIFLTLRRIQSHTIINVHRSSSNVPVIIVRFYTEFSQNTFLYFTNTITDDQAVHNIKRHLNFSPHFKAVQQKPTTPMCKT